MQSPYAKLIPTTVLIAILGYLSWTYLELDPPPVGPQAKLPEVAADHLSPPTLPKAERDPFGDSVRFELGEIQPTDRTGRRTSGQQIKPTGGAMANQKPQTAGNGPNEKGSPATATSPNPGAPVVPPRASTAMGQNPTIVGKTANAGKILGQKSAVELVLNATLLDGQQQIAVINGRAYRTGERLDSSSAAEGCLIAEIHHHRVVLVRDGKVENLTYADRVSSPSLGKPQTAQRAAGAQNGKPLPARPAANARAQTR